MSCSSRPGKYSVPFDSGLDFIHVKCSEVVGFLNVSFFLLVPASPPCVYITLMESDEGDEDTLSVTEDQISIKEDMISSTEDTTPPEVRPEQQL